MRTVPPEVILSWPNPNYTDPTTRGNALVIVNAIFISIAVIVVALRLYTRIWIKCWFGSDDAFIVLALISTIGLAATVLLANQSYGWNRHIYDVPFNQLEPASKIAMAAKLIFTSAATFTRLSLLFFYYRLIQDGGRPLFRWAVHANVALSVAIFIAFFFLAIFLCSPVKNYWTFGAPPGSCLDEGKATLAAGIINCVADLLCTVTPIPLVISLQMPRRQRILVNLLFSLGFIVTIAGIVRTWFIYKCFIADYDQTWYSYPLWIAAAIEIDLGVICASAPVLRPLIAKVPGCLFSITSSLSGKSRSSPNHSDHTAQGSKRGVPTGTMLKSEAGTTRPGESDSVPNVFDQQYEMGTWVDIEGGHRPSATLSRGSQDAILSISGSANDPVTYTNVRAVR